MTKCVFLDRDGTVIYDKGYTGKVEDVKLIPRAAEAIKKLNNAGFLVIVTSNQSGIARGYFDIDAVSKVNAEIQRKLAKYGAYIDASYYCPHFTEGKNKKYVKKCLCRKPSQGMIKVAIRDFKIDIKKSFVVGDKLTDVLFGKRAAAKTILVLTGEGEEEAKKITEKSKPDFIAKDLHSAVKKILS